MDRRNFLGVAPAAVGAAAAGTLLPRAPLSAAPNPAGRRLKVGMVGTTHSHARGKMEALRRAPDWFEVVGVAEPDPARRAKLEGVKAYAGLPVLAEDALLDLPGLDAVLVETAIDAFVPTAQRCVEAGLHVHLEKPAGSTLPPFRQLVEACARGKRVLQMGYMFRYNPAFQLIFRAAREGWLGAVYEVHGVIGKTVGQGARDEMARFPGGAMFELGCHLIDAAVAVLGIPSAVHAFLQRTRPDRDTLADNTLAVLVYPRATATVRSTVVDVEGFRRRTFAVHGDRGAATLFPLEPPGLKLTLDAGREAGGATYRKGTHAVDLPVPRGRYDDQLEDFARQILTGAASGLPAGHDLAVQESLLRGCGMGVE